MPKGGVLSIETEDTVLDEIYFQEHGVTGSPGHFVRIAVSDNGTGMEKAIQNRIFEPFYTTKGKHKGTGLGLSMVYGHVKQNRGYVWVYSEPGKGTTFKIYFPKYQAETDVSVNDEKAVEKEEFMGSETILIVEDDESLRKVAVKFLNRFGYNVIEAENPENALRIGKKHNRPIHLLLTDVIMPGMSGADLARLLKKERANLKIIFMSGYTDDTISLHGLLDPKVNFIQKPFTKQTLGKKLREIIDGNP